MFNFYAGPSVLPKPVLEQAQRELLNFNSTGMSIMEISHRSKAFKEVIEGAEADFRKLLGVPNNYKVLFMQGGGSSQFSAVVYNMLVDSAQDIDYICTGQWSTKAYKEAKRLGANANLIYSSKDGPLNPENLSFSKNPAFIYYCDNETVDGIELPTNFIDSLPKNTPVVCDMSSNIASRKFDISKFAIIFAGAQKNIGPSGITIVVVREDYIGLFEKCPIKGPIMLDYKTTAENGSLYNTPPTFPIYMCGLVFKFLLENGGISAIEKANQIKADTLYSFIDKTPFLICKTDKRYRSRMNVVFRILKNGNPDELLEKEFCAQAELHSMVGLNGHRSVGGIRASIYNSLSIEAVYALIDFITEFGKTL